MCGMEPSKKTKGRYESYTDISEIEASRLDCYKRLAEKAAFAVGIQENEGEELALFKPAIGSRIVNEDITARDGMMVPWSVGARKGAEKVSFGVGVVIPHSQVVYTSIL